MYPEEMIKPMRAELTQLGFKELHSGSEVDAVLSKPESGTALLVVNSMCGCAAGAARPAVALALKNPKVPSKLYTVFAGQDKEATERARAYFAEIPPSSPSMALLKDGKVVHFIHRQDIEGRSAQQIAANLKAAFDTHC